MNGDTNSGRVAARGGRGKFITLALLVAWVMAVFLFTLWKFSAVAR